MLFVSEVQRHPHQQIGYIKSQIIGDNLNLLGLVKIAIFPTIYKSSLTIVLTVYPTQNLKNIESPFSLLKH